MSQILQSIFNGGTGTGPVYTLTGNSGGAVAPSAGGNINIVGSGDVVVTDNPGTNTLTISVTGGGLTWYNVTTATQQLASNSGYITSHNGQITFSLPSTPSFGDVIRIVGNNVGGWLIDFSLPSGSLTYITQTTNTTITSVDIADQLEMVCLNAVTNAWIVLTATGSLTI